MQKVQKLKMDPCSSLTSPQPKNCPKLHKKHHRMQRKVGLSENPPKKNKNAIYSKRAGSNISEPNFYECTLQDVSKKVGHLSGTFLKPTDPSGTW